jgi:hypothetical protein
MLARTVQEETHGHDTPHRGRDRMHHRAPDEMDALRAAIARAIADGTLHLPEAEPVPREPPARREPVRRKRVAAAPAAPAAEEPAPRRANVRVTLRRRVTLAVLEPPDDGSPIPAEVDRLPTDRGELATLIPELRATAERARRRWLMLAMQGTAPEMVGEAARALDRAVERLALAEARLWCLEHGARRPWQRVKGAVIARAA